MQFPQHPSRPPEPGMITVVWAHVQLKATALTLPLAQEAPVTTVSPKGSRLILAWKVIIWGLRKPGFSPTTTGISLFTSASPHTLWGHLGTSPNGRNFHAITSEFLLCA